MLEGGVNKRSSLHNAQAGGECISLNETFTKVCIIMVKLVMVNYRELACTCTHECFTLCRVTWVSIFDGTLYKKSCALVLKMDEYYPLFGKLLDIFVVDCTQVYFQVQVLETLIIIIIVLLFNCHQ